MARILITSALPYINGVKHLGNLVGSMLPADVYARFARLQGHEVLYICATDEHGTPAELAALEAGLPVAEYCRQLHTRHSDLGQRFGLSWDYFGRSSSPQNRELTQHFHDRLSHNGLIAERTTEQVFSIDDGRFLPDRYVVGSCPHCGYEAARGDQCENCTRVLDPADLVDPRSAISGSTNIEIRTSRHLFLLQSKLTDQVRSWIDSHGDWPRLVTSIARKWLDEGLHDRGITRDLSWGVPVNRAGFEDKVFYVWFDAPIEYIGATKEWAQAGGLGDDAWGRWWRRDRGAGDVRYVQFMAKDNIPFHTVSFPVTLLGSGEPWTVVDYIKGFNWLGYYGGKFSTSHKRGVFMDQALELLPADYWRWYLVANAPEGADSSFTWEHFQATVNKDLADVLGNFVNRVATFCADQFSAQVPEGGAAGPLEEELAANLGRRLGRYSGFMAALEFRKSAAELRAIWALGNEYVDRAQPWHAIQHEPERAAVAVRTGLNLVRLFAILSRPLIPATSDLLLAALGLDGAEVRWPTAAGDELRALDPGRPIAVPARLFDKVSDEQVTAWKAAFGGDQA